jgi:hypothetical protein
VDLSDDHPPPRRPLFFPVVIATVFLGIIGMSAGLVLGSRHEEPVRAGPTSAPVSSPTFAATSSPAGRAARRHRTPLSWSAVPGR